MTLDSSGNKVGELRYRPYGETRYTWGSRPTDRRFTDQRQEASIGLYDYGARFYSPYLNRRIQPDTIVPDPANPQAFNRYSYVLNNPLKYTDPTGHMDWEGEGGGTLKPEDIYWKHFRLRTPWDQLSVLEQSIILQYGGHADPTMAAVAWNTEIARHAGGNTTNVAGTLADPATYIPIGGGARVVSRLAEEAAFKIGVWCLVRPVCASLIFGAGSRAANNSRAEIGGGAGEEALRLSNHALQRMAERGVSLNQVQAVINSAQPFKYFHDGVWKIGYYDPVSRIFVGEVQGIISTVITNVKPQYIENLKKAVP